MQLHRRVTTPGKGIIMDILDMILRIGLGLLLGAAIGFERQWRARTAGLRTNALVSLGATLFVLLGAYSFGGGDPTRVAAQIVSGIGFLGAGVIMKRGPSISGLNTAATLWASAAVGALAGTGSYLVAIAGTAAIILANTFLRPMGRLLDRGSSNVGREIPPVSYEFTVRCPEDAEATVRALVFDAVHRDEFTVQSVTSTDTDAGVVIVATLTSSSRDDRALERAIERVVHEPAVTAVQWSATNLEVAD